MKNQNGIDYQKIIKTLLVLHIVSMLIGIIAFISNIDIYHKAAYIGLSFSTSILNIVIFEFFVTKKIIELKNMNIYSLPYKEDKNHEEVYRKHLIYKDEQRKFISDIRKDYYGKSIWAIFFLPIRIVVNINLHNFFNIYSSTFEWSIAFILWFLIGLLFLKIIYK